MSRKYYQTKDLYLASVLLMLGYTLDRMEKKGKLFNFYFAETIKLPDQVMRLSIDTIKGHVADYWADKLSLNPKQIFYNFKKLKNLMYSDETKNRNSNFFINFFYIFCLFFQFLFSLIVLDISLSL